MMSFPITKYVFAVQVVQRQQLAQEPTALNPCMTIPLLPSSGAGRDRVCQWFASWDLNQEMQQLDVGATA